MPRPRSLRSEPWDACQAPWPGQEHAAGWETVYGGTGQRRESTSRLVLELTPEQNEWLDRAAEAAGVTPPAIVKRLIDSARAGDG